MFKLNFHSIKMWFRKKEKLLQYLLQLSWQSVCTVESRAVGIIPSLALGLALIFPAFSRLGCLKQTKMNVSFAAFAFCLVWFHACAQYSKLGVLSLAYWGARTVPSGQPDPWQVSFSCCRAASSVQLFSFLLRLCQYFFLKPPEGVIGSQQCPPILGELSRQRIQKIQVYLLFSVPLVQYIYSVPLVRCVPSIYNF